MLTHIDCFSGAGGICTGFKAAGIKTLIAIEKVESCVITYKANHSDVFVFHDDIRNVHSDKITSIVKNVDIVTGGMPCETFSTAGSKSRSFYDDRQTLYHEVIRIASALNANMILLENVPGITTKKTTKKGSTYVIDQIFEDLDKYGYTNYICTTLNASDFGIPQYRERFFILASNHSHLNLAFPSSSNLKNKKAIVKDAFAGLPEVQANEKEIPDFYTDNSSDYADVMRDASFWKLPCNDKLTYHIPPNHRASTLKRFSLIEPGEGLRDLFIKFSLEEVARLQRDKVLPNKWYIQRNRRLFLDRPSVTVTSHCLDEIVHPFYNRSLTVREVARLQSFPDMYDFLGGPIICPHIYETQDKYEQIGDAVPPLLAYYIGKCIQNVIHGTYRKENESKNNTPIQMSLF